MVSGGVITTAKLAAQMARNAIILELSDIIGDYRSYGMDIIIKISITVFFFRFNLYPIQGQFILIQFVMYHLNMILSLFNQGDRKLSVHTVNKLLIPF